VALVIGSLAIVGLPPFGLFISEFFILTAAFTAGRFQVAALMLVSLSVVFGALLYHFQAMLMGESGTQPSHPKWLRSEFVVIGICAVSLLVLGVRVPAALTNLLHVAMGVLQ
jgi:hydrogenase-4 component F